MELVNNRFRIIKHLKHDQLITSYLVNDMWEDNKIMQLNIINLNNIPKTIIDYYCNEFISLVNYNNKYIVNIYNFNVVSYIDNKKITYEQYFYTNEYINDFTNLLEFSKNKSIKEKLDLFVELCTIFNLFHLKGHIYNAINLNNIYIVNNSDNYHIKIKDIASKELENKSYLADNYRVPFFISPINHNSQKNDIYSLIALLLVLFKDDCNLNNSPQIEITDFYQKLKNKKYKNLSQEDIEIIYKLKPIFEKTFIFTEEFPYTSLNRLIQGLNNLLNTNYQFNYQEDLIKVNFHLKMIGRENEIAEILNSYNNMLNYNPFTKIFLLKGEMGCGKTRFLEELKFRFELKKAYLYDSFHLSSLNESSDKMWSEIIRKLIIDTDREIIDKYETELIKFFPEIFDRNTDISQDYLEEHQTKYRLLNRIIGFISESIENKHAVFIIDNIDLANEFTLDTFTYLYTELIKKRNIMLIFSYNENNIYKNKKFAEFITNISKNPDSKTISIKNLNEQQAGKMIKNMLDMSYTPIKLTEKIYSQSYGNPLFISEVIKDFYNRKILYVEKRSGYWHVDIPDDDEDYKFLIIPNSIEQAVLNQIKDLDEISNEILNVMSIFPNFISINELNYFIDESNIIIYLQELIKKGIISKVIGTSDNLYTINNRVLKDIIYEKIPYQEKINKHIMVAKKLEKEIDSDADYEDLIYHYECAKNNEKVIEYSLQYAKKMHDAKNFLDEIKSLKKALHFINDYSEKTNILFKISTLYYELGNDNDAIIFLSEAEKHANEIKDYKQLININLNLGKLALNNNDYEECKKRLENTVDLLKKYRDLEVELECQQLQANLLLYEKRFDECSQILWQIVDKCENNYPRIEADCYRLLAYIYSRGNKVSEALNLYNKALNLFQLSNYIRGELICLNNIGTIYSDIYQNETKALEYYHKVKEISEEYGAEIYGIVALINIACHYEMAYEYELSYYHFKQSLDKSLKGNYLRQILYSYHMLTKICLNLNYFTEAYNYHCLANELITKSANLGLDIVDFYKSSGDLYYTFGDFERAQENIINSIEFYKSGVSYEQFQYMIKSRIINLRLKPRNTYEDDIIEIILTSQKFVATEMKIESLSNAAIILGRRNDYKNAQLLINEIKTSLPKKMHDITSTKYYLALGINENSDKKLNYLLKALKLAKKQTNKILLVDTIICIGDYYYNNKEYFSAVNYYLEAWEILKYLIQDIPDDYKLSFVNSFEYINIYYKIKYIYNLIVGITIFNNDEFNELQDKYNINSLEELEKIIQEDLISKFKNNHDFMNFISLQFREHLPKQPFEVIDLISNISNDTISNIKLVINYFAAITFATNAYLFIENDKHEFINITSLNENEKIPDIRNIIEKTKISTKPILLSRKDNNLDTDYFSIEKTACLCIPITNNFLEDYYDNLKNNIIGYLYLDSDKIIHNINENGLQKCLEIINFLALLIEKHQLKIDASIDKLTGTLTRQYLEETINIMIYEAEKNKDIFSVIMYDLDNFKNVNDRFGHQTGDEVLSNISKIVIDNISKEDYIGRYGGEEFIIILPHKDANEALAIANDLRKKIYEKKILGHKIDITVSMGIATYPIHGKTRDELLESVDQALYISKESGKNCCNIWDGKYSLIRRKTKDMLTGIISGNTVEDSRNILAIVELIQLSNKNIASIEKIYQFLGRTIEVIEASYGYLFIIENNQVIDKYGRQAQKEEWVSKISINENLLNKAIENGQGTYLIDWDDIGKADLITGIPDWNSIIINPILVKDEVKAVLYYTISTRIKEFGDNEFNFINILSNLVPAIIS